MTDDPEPREPVPDPAVTPIGSPDPEVAVGKLDASLPFLKKKAVELLNGSTPEVGR